MSLSTYNTHRRRRRMIGRLSAAAAIVVVGSAAVAVDPLDVGVDGADSEPPVRTPSINPPEPVVPDVAASVSVEDLIAETPALGGGEEESPDVPDVPEGPGEPEEPVSGAEDPPEPVDDAAPAAGVWDDLAACESNGDWSINTGNGYYGGLQFNLDSWDWAGGDRYASYPHEASRTQQIAVAERLLEIHPAGWGAWPACSRQLGLH
ncbi:MAG: transglycosylase family protein [Nitriliruptoraceae bacterium]